MCPILKCITFVPTLTPFSIIYGFAHLFTQLPLFLPVFSLHAFPFKNVELPLHITVFPDPPNTNQTLFRVPEISLVPKINQKIKKKQSKNWRKRKTPFWIMIWETKRNTEG